MSARRQELLDLLEAHYRDSAWPVERCDDGTIRAAGVSGVTWIGMAVVPEDLVSSEFESRLIDLSEQRMPEGGELCPFELLPAEECAEDLRGVLARLRLDDRGHIAVYSLAA